jgi:hypothetical protein
MGLKSVEREFPDFLYHGSTSITNVRANTALKALYLPGSPAALSLLET